MVTVKLSRLLVALVLTATAAFPAAAMAGDEIDFHELLHLAMLNRSVRLLDPDQIVDLWRSSYSSVVVVDVHRTRSRYLLATDDRQKTQEIAIRGTTNVRNLVYDLRFTKVYDPELGISAHRGFLTMARALHRNLVPRLVPGYQLTISGQSLGAAEALLVAMMLSKEGYHVERVVTFGQPKVTDGRGAERYASLPLTRVVDQNDPVPLLPPDDLYAANPYVHFGREIVLLRGDYYAVVPPAVRSEPFPTRLLTMTADDLWVLLREHSIRTYVASLRLKLGSPREVPWKDREKYIDPAYAY